MSQRTTKPRSAERPIPEDLLVTVCDACNRCCCWQGIFFCDDYMEAGTKEITVAEWRQIMETHPNREHEDYLRSDEAVKEWERNS